MKGNINGKIMSGTKGIQSVGEDGKGLKFCVRDEKGNEILCYVARSDLVKALRDNDVLKEIDLILSGEIEYKPKQNHPVLVVEQLFISATELPHLKARGKDLPSYVDGIVAIEK